MNRLALVFFFFAPAAFAQATPESARGDIVGTYDFEPSRLSYEEQVKRAPALTGLWDRYDKAPGTYYDALRGLLASEGKRELLYCDGGMLLLHKSQLPEDLELGLRSLAKCSLAEIEQTPYFYAMHELAIRGVDTLELQFRMLARPKYSVFVVRRALNLGQNYAFLYPLLVRDEATYVPRVIDRLKTESDGTARETLLLALYYAATPQSERALRSSAKDGASPVAERTRAAKIVANIDRARALRPGEQMLEQMRQVLELKGNPPEEELRSRRRARMHAVSDEALIELEALTVLIYRTSTIP